MQATLKSSDGEWEFVLALLHPETYATEPGLQSSLHVSGQHWDGDHYFPFEVSVQGLWLRAPQLILLHDRLTAWLGLPLADLDPVKLDGEQILTGLPGQVLSLRFGKHREIPSPLKRLSLSTSPQGLSVVSSILRPTSRAWQAFGQGLAISRRRPSNGAWHLTIGRTRRIAAGECGSGRRR